ncbi:MAG: Gmad2 immunoglobulin-like domain-containing protein, partial [Acidimicrobiia bacterium]
VATVPANRGETPSTTEGTAPPPAPASAADEVGPGIWPFTTGAEADASDESAYTDPVETARRFLTEYVGFTRLTMGEFAQGDSRSGEVTATSRTDGPVTTVLVRLLGSSDRWTVIGAVTPNIVLGVPGALEEVGSPVRIEGRSTAFEGNVVVEVRQDGGPRTTLGLEPLTGGSMGELGPLVGNVPIRTPTERGGAVLATTDSAMDGAVEEATVVRVRFAGPEDPGG